MRSSVYSRGCVIEREREINYFRIVSKMQFSSRCFLVDEKCVQIVENCAAIVAECIWLQLRLFQLLMLFNR